MSGKTKAFLVFALLLLLFVGFLFLTTKRDSARQAAPEQQGSEALPSDIRTEEQPLPGTANS